jgi:hypothetical protein
MSGSDTCVTELNNLNHPACSPVSAPTSTHSKIKRMHSACKTWALHTSNKAGFQSVLTSSEQKRKLFTDRIRTRTAQYVPPCVTSITVFCDELLFYGPPNSDDLVLIDVNDSMDMARTPRLPYFHNAEMEQICQALPPGNRSRAACRVTLSC